jgi:DNA-directed RNA polymerase specialized sigma24 family protein
VTDEVISGLPELQSREHVVPHSMQLHNAAAATPLAEASQLWRQIQRCLKQLPEDKQKYFVSEKKVHHTQYG